MKTSLEDMKELMINRAKLYSFFSRIYREEVDKELLDRLKVNSDLKDIDDPEMVKRYSDLRKFLQNKEFTGEFLDDLAADYADLFLGIGKHPAHPYESVYRSEDHIVMREPRSEVLKIYSSEGLQKVDEFKEPEDHIAIEFEFMAYLCLKIKDTLDSNDKAGSLKLLKAQNDFLEKHLLSWIPSFCDDIVNGSAKYDFYKSMGAITRRYLVIDGETMSKLIKEMK